MEDAEAAEIGLEAAAADIGPAVQVPSSAEVSELEAEAEAEADVVDPASSSVPECSAAAADIETLPPAPGFDQHAWEPDMMRYGIAGMLRIRQSMLPIAMPEEVRHIKRLNSPNYGHASDDRDDHNGGDRRGGGPGPDRGKGKQKAKEKPLPKPPVGGGRYIEDMGKTEIIPDYQKGQWWRNIGIHTDIIIRDEFSLHSQEIGRVKPGWHLQQAGWAEVFVSGKAAGLQRMPVQPRGWVTIDAASVGGPRYCEPCPPPRWKVVFSMNNGKADIVVRSGVSLASSEIGSLMCGMCVDQSGPTQTLEDGIIRMPIWFEAPQAEASYPSQPPKPRSGWVTRDATAQGGPMFFEFTTQVDPRRVQQPAAPKASAQRGPPRNHRDDDDGGGGGFRGGAGEIPPSSWARNRVWRVCNLSDQRLAMVTKPEPFAPGDTRKSPPEGILVRWLKDGDIVEQVGHSKKTRGHMVMPIRMLADDRAPNTGFIVDGQQADGWVTRRFVDKQKEQEAGGVWFVELNMHNYEEVGRNQRRETRARRALGAD